MHVTGGTGAVRQENTTCLRIIVTFRFAPGKGTAPVSFLGIHTGRADAAISVPASTCPCVWSRQRFLPGRPPPFHSRRHFHYSLCTALKPYQRSEPAAVGVQAHMNFPRVRPYADTRSIPGQRWYVQTRPAHFPYRQQTHQ